MLTDNAISRVEELLRASGRYGAYLRIYIEGGGCSGFKYMFALDDVVQSDDHVLSFKTKSDLAVKVLIDPMSYELLVDAKVDFIRDLQGERFQVVNPLAKTTCSCGSSFTLD